MNKYNEDNYAAFSKLLRTTFDAALESFGDQTVDLLHIDGLHTYKAVRHDFETWFPKVRPGGVVLLHDTTARHADFGVWQLWEELARQFPHFEFTHSWGLGVLQKPGGSASDSLLRTLLSGSTVEQEFLRHYYSSQALVLERRAVDREAAAPARTRFSVFPNLAGGYSESTAVRTTLAPGEWHHVVLELTQGSGRGRIRVDPAERPCLIQIAGVLLRRAVDGAVVRDWSTAGAMQAFSPTVNLVRLGDNDGLHCLSTGGDPQLLLPELDHALADQPLIFEARVRISEDLAPAVALLQSVAVSTPDQTTARAALEAALESKTVECDTALASLDKAVAERDTALVRSQQLSAEIRNLQAERVAVVAEYRRVHATNESLQNRLASDEQRWLRERDGSHRRAGHHATVAILAAHGAVARVLPGDPMNRVLAAESVDVDRPASRQLRVTIVIPVFGAAAQLRDCLESLSRHAPPGCEVLVADDATPDDSVSEVTSAFQSRLSLTYTRRRENLGFVENCNEAIRSILPSGNDVLLLNSDTRGHRRLSRRDVGGPASAREARCRLPAEQQRDHFLRSCFG